MAQQVCHLRIKFPNATTLEDASSIGFTAESTGANVTLPFETLNTVSGTSVEAWVKGFFESLASGQTNPMSYYMSGDLSRAANAVEMEAYDVTNALDGSPAGSPITTYSWTLGAAQTVAGLPSACCAAVGLRTDYGSDIEHGAISSLPSDDSAQDQGAPSTHQGRTRPRARDRGRFYFGPLTEACSASIHENGAGVNALETTFTADLKLAIASMMAVQNSGNNDQFNMVIWSRRAGTVKRATWYYVDEGFALQRRRGDTTEARVHSWVNVP